MINIESVYLLEFILIKLQMLTEPGIFGIMP
jgi:hypothetical protein